jgi:transposase
MMPMYHWLPERIESHVKICVLALLIERIAELKCGSPWSRIKSVLSKMQVTEFQTKGHVFCQLNELPKGAKTILKKLEIQRPRRVLGVKHIKKELPIV